MKTVELLQALSDEHVQYVAAIDDLLLMKRIASRFKDRLDIEALEKIKLGEDPNA
jgi:hypothetical protein